VPGALDGIRVLEFSFIAAGPFLGVSLSDHGADVVKVEPLEGEHYRNVGAVVPKEGKRFQSLNRGKRSIFVDLEHARGRELIHRLVPGVDVVTCNMRLGVSKRLGVDYETLSALNPRLIYANISGFGPRGPWAHRPATDLVLSAYTGMMAVQDKREPDDTPANARPPINDYATGLAAGMAVCAALFHRERTGRGQLIEASLLQTAMNLLDYHVMREPVSDATISDPLYEEIQRMRAAGRPYSEQIRLRTDSGVTIAGPPRLYYRCYQAKDGAIGFGCLTPANRAAARKVLGIEGDYSDNPDFDVRNPEHMSRFEEWQEQITRTVLSKTVREWMELFNEAGVPAAPVHFPEDLSNDPQVEAMGFMQELVHDVTGPQRVPGPIVLMSDSPTAARRPAPAYARHTDEVLGEHGLTREEIDSLRGAGAIR
jgi:formyl-CoA transferase